MKKHENDKKSINALKTVVSDGVHTTYAVQLTKEQFEELQKKRFSERITAIMNRYGLKQPDLISDGMDSPRISRYVSGQVLPKEFSINAIVEKINSNDKVKPDRINIEYLLGKSDQMTIEDAERYKAFIDDVVPKINDSTNKRHLLDSLLLITLKVFSKYSYNNGDIISGDSSVSFDEIAEKYRKEMSWYSECILRRLISDHFAEQEEQSFRDDLNDEASDFITEQIDRLFF